MRSPEAAARRRISSRPSLLRTEPARNCKGLGERSLRVVALLEGGKSRLEAAREVGLDKANVRVIELRARRRGMLAGVETRVEVFAAYAPRPHASAIRMALAANPADTDRDIAARTGVTPSTVAEYRDRLGIPRSKRGPRGPRRAR